MIAIPRPPSEAHQRSQRRRARQPAESRRSRTPRRSAGRRSSYTIREAGPGRACRTGRARPSTRARVAEHPGERFARRRAIPSGQVAERDVLGFAGIVSRSPSRGHSGWVHGDWWDSSGLPG
jgi:hypothetical protein